MSNPSLEPLLSNDRLASQDEHPDRLGRPSDNAHGDTTAQLSSSNITDRATRRYKRTTPLWIFAPWIIGITIGLLHCSFIPSPLPPPLDKISRIIGWVYFSAWSFSFYPQIWTNYRRKSVIGLSIDFQLLNILGFLSYTIYNSALYYSTVVREQYQAVHSGQLPAVHINDVAFSIHALVLSSISLTQCFLYRTTHNNNDDENFEENFEEENIVERTPQHHHHHKPATASLVAISIAVIISTIWAGVIFLTPTVDPPPTPCTWASKSSCPPESIFTWLTWLYFLSGIKFLVTLVKYMPQVVLNCQRQSTEGWNVWNVLLDFEGGVLSLAQQIIDAAVCQSLIPLIGSPIKFGLSLISMVFDVIFMVQHFVLYPDSKRKVAGEAMAADYTRLA